MPANDEMNSAMQSVTNTVYGNNDQNKEIGKTRVARDSKDTKEILAFLYQRSPFDVTDNSLRNIVTGVTASEKVTADRAKDIGVPSINDMIGEPVETFQKVQAG